MDAIRIAYAIDHLKKAAAELEHALAPKTLARVQGALAAAAADLDQAEAEAEHAIKAADDRELT